MARRNYSKKLVLSDSQVAVLKRLQAGEAVKLSKREALPLLREFLISWNFRGGTADSRYKLAERGEKLLRGEQLTKYTSVAHAPDTVCKDLTLCNSRGEYSPTIVGVNDHLGVYPKVTCRKCKVLLGQAEPVLTHAQRAVLKVLVQNNGECIGYSAWHRRAQYRVREALISRGLVERTQRVDAKYLAKGIEITEDVYTITNKGRAAIGAEPVSAPAAQQGA